MTQYREVKRKATVGERVRVFGHAMVTQNTEHVVTSVESDGHIHYAAGGRRPGGYVVLEPVTPDDVLSAAFRQFVLDNADAIRAILPALETQLSAEAPVTAMQMRAEVIAKASAGVAELLQIGRSRSASLPVGQFRTKFYTAEFHVNREKHTVTALVSTTNLHGQTLRKNVAKGIAKCAPGDVFHAEIGKAIALHKALGLTVPDEFLNAPELTVNDDVLAGTVVELTRNPRYALIHDWKNGRLSRQTDVIRILDDTDVAYGLAPLSAGSTKGAAA